MQARSAKRRTPVRQARSVGRVGAHAQGRFAERVDPVELDTLQE